MIEKFIKKAAAAVISEADKLTELDQAIGDGDHGLNMRRGMEAVVAALPQHADKPVGRILWFSGMEILTKVGGASGPLYGTFAMEFGRAMPEGAPTRADIAKAFGAAVAGVAARGKAEVGQKTMLDVLAPVQAAIEAGKTPREIKAVALAAANATIPMKAQRGRASFLGDRSIGHMDPGARSSALIIATICDALES